MVVLVVTASFKRAAKKLEPDVRQRMSDALKTFQQNMRHPSLHFEKLTNSAYRTIRVDRGRWRIVLRRLPDGSFELVDIGRHDYVDREYG